VIVPFAIGLMLFLATRALRPLAAFSASLAQMSPDSLESVATPEVRELRPLAAALNSLIARLRASRESERAFVADAAHELRTPLASIRLYADVVAGEHDPDKVRDVVRQIATGADRASHLVNQLLALAGLDAEDTLEMRRFDVADAVRDALSLVLPIADARGVNLAMDGDALVPVKGHQAAIAILLGNLLRNAVAHSPPDTTVTTTLLRDRSVVVIAVTDEGPGIPAAERERIFERFVRLPGQERAGTGLGLSIVARVVALHRGSVAVENTATGGARFVVRLPIGM
jgi:signal transduction histidine kinase